LGCPHFLQKNDTTILNTFNILKERFGSETEELRSEFNIIFAEQLNLDFNIRKARFGFRLVLLATDDAPDRDQADKNAGPLLEKFNKNNTRLELLRLKVLEKVRIILRENGINEARSEKL
jgi:hypothetical protein